MDCQAQGRRAANPTPVLKLQRLFLLLAAGSRDGELLNLDMEEGRKIGVDQGMRGELELDEGAKLNKEKLTRNWLCQAEY